jgi:hypothetical protein
MIALAEQLMHNALAEQLRAKADGLLMHLREAAHLVAPAERAMDKADELAMEGRYEEAWASSRRPSSWPPRMRLPSVPEALFTPICTATRRLWPIWIGLYS